MPVLSLILLSLVVSLLFLILRPIANLSLTGIQEAASVHFTFVFSPLFDARCDACSGCQHNSPTSGSCATLLDFPFHFTFLRTSVYKTTLRCPSTAILVVCRYSIAAFDEDNYIALLGKHHTPHWSLTRARTLTAELTPYT
jgi:hypothetical protein